MVGKRGQKLVKQMELTMELNMAYSKVDMLVDLMVVMKVRK